MSKKDTYDPISAWRIVTDPKKGITPAIILCNPKFARNVGMITRLASCYGVKQVWFTGKRVEEDVRKWGRIPREERMKGYEDVELIYHERPLDFFPEATPIAIEVRENSELLHQFDHPKNPVYIYGPEDGSLPKWVLHKCHRFVVIPTRHCLNLSTAVSTILWDSQYKEYIGGKEITDYITPGIIEQRGFEYDE